MTFRKYQINKTEIYKDKLQNHIDLNILTQTLLFKKNLTIYQSKYNSYNNEHSSYKFVKKEKEFYKEKNNDF